MEQPRDSTLSVHETSNTDRLTFSEKLRRTAEERTRTEPASPDWFLRDTSLARRTPVASSASPEDCFKTLSDYFVTYP